MRSFSTPSSTWIRAIGFDATLAVFLAYGYFLEAPFVLKASVFVLWWVLVLAAFGLTIMYFTSKFEVSVNGAPPKQLLTVRTIERLAVSPAFLFYHWATDLGFVAALTAMGYYWLAGFQFTTLLLSSLVIGVCRRLKCEMDDVEAAKISGIPPWRAPFADTSDLVSEGGTTD